MSAEPSSYRWWLLGALCGIYIGFGLVSTSLAPLVGVISDDLGLSRAQMGTILGAWQLMYLGWAVPAGRLLGRVGMRWGLLLGIALIVASGVARAAATGWVSLFAAVAVFGFGGPLVSIGTPALVSAWFTGDQRGPATGIAVSGPVIGSVLSLLLTNSVLMPLTGDRWRAVVLIHTAAAAAAGVVWLVVTARPPADRVRPWHGGSGPVAGSRQLLGVPIMRLMLVLAVGTFFINHAFRNWLPEMLRDSGLTAAEAGVWAAIPSLLGLAGGVMVPRFATADRRRMVLAACYTVMGLGVLSLIGDFTVLAVVGLVGIGMVRSAVGPVAMLFLMDSPRVGPTNMAPAAGLYFTAGEVGGVTGPLAVGLLATGGTFASSQVLLATVAGSLALLVSFGFSTRQDADPRPM